MNINIDDFTGCRIYEIGEICSHGTTNTARIDVTGFYVLF